MLHTLSAFELSKKFKDGSFSARQILDHYFKRIEQYDSSIDSFLHLTKEYAYEQADSLDKKRKSGIALGKLSGVPIALKDNIHVQGIKSTCGSKILENFVAPFDATATRLLKDEDALIVGKTNLDEFAMGSSTEHSAFKKTKNPWDLSCVPGGSSGGSAAAVAARLVPLSLGSDTGGSVRQPAALCGVFGLKPTYGRISRYGLVAYGSSLDQIGPIATSVEDIALIMEILGTHCQKDSTSIPREREAIVSELNYSIAKKKIGIPYAFLEGLSPTIRTLFDQSLQVYKDLGAELVNIDLSILKYSLPTYYILATAEASTNLARFDGIRYGLRSSKAKTLEEIYDYTREEGFGKEVKKRILLGTFVLSAGYQDAYYKKAQKIRALIIQQYKKAFSMCDCIATPTSPCTAFQIGSIKDPLTMYLEDIYTISANLAGVPAISIPAGFESHKPFGLQLTGPQLSEKLICQMAHAYTKSTNFHTLLPKQFER